MRKLKKITATVLSFAMILTSVFTTNVNTYAKVKKSVKSVKITNVKGNKLTLSVNKTFTLKTKVTVTGGASKSLTFVSGNKKIATVSSKGKIKAVKPGSVTIKAISKFNKKKKAEIKVTVKKNSTNTEDKAKFYPCSKKYTEKDVVFEDNFNGNKLNEKYWNYELHEPGWVNNELQEYVKSDKNVYVKDGKLVIQALKDKNGNYTSGRVNTQNKIDYKYGRFEARLKVPEGKGFLPAFWMMPTDESLYGQWPKCGEIDIMEVLGSDTKTAYSTLHFGEPHKERQGSIKIDKGDFYRQYHTYTCEWEPGKISFYVDGKFVHEENNWYSKKEGFENITYPAPFDQPFYMILNLAVGGDWPGNPDNTTTFDERARMVVDYVKVYHKGDKSYVEAEENAKRPATGGEVAYKEADSTGNYVTNGNFTDSSIDFTDDNNWKFLTAGTGKATPSIKDNELIIDTEDAGDLDYSVQVIQSYMPMIKGAKYKLSFDAYADEARTMITDISAPENGWIRYLDDKKISLTKDKQHFEYEFDMKKDSDAFGRVEFNLGNQGSTAKVHIANVRLEKTGTFEVSNQLPDGNFVYNGSFDRGDDGIKRMNHWDVTNNCSAKVGVTNVNNIREFNAAVPASVKELGDLVLAQKNITIKPGTKYSVSFTARADRDSTIKTAIAGNEFESKLTKEPQEFKYSFNSDKEAFDDADKTLKFLLGTEGNIYIDNVRIQDDALITNGNFKDGMTGFEVFIDSSISDKVSKIIDNQQEGNDDSCEITIKDTGDADWKIQLKQDNVKLEKGKWYTFSFDAKSNIERAIKYAFQRDGSDHKNDDGSEDWRSYSGDGNDTVDLTSTFKTYKKTFQMTEDTDPETILSISMGAVNGKQITKEHKITIDNISLVEATDPSSLVKVEK